MYIMPDTSLSFCCLTMTPPLLKFKKSTQKEVVNAVSAESVVANVAAVKPNINTIPGIIPKYCRAIVGYKIIGFGNRYMIMCCVDIKQRSNTQKENINKHKHCRKAEHILFSLRGCF